MSLIQSLLAASLEEAELVNVVDDETTETLTESLLAAKDATTELHTALDASERLSSTADALTAMTLVDAPNSPLVLAATEAIYLSCGLEAEAATQPGMVQRIWDAIVKMFRTIIISVRNFFGRYFTAYGKVQRMLETVLKETERFDIGGAVSFEIPKDKAEDLQYGNHDVDIARWIVGFEKTTELLANLMNAHGGLLSEAKMFLADDKGAFDYIRKEHADRKHRRNGTLLIGGYIYNSLEAGDAPTVMPTRARDDFDKNVRYEDLTILFTKKEIIDLARAALTAIKLVRRENELTDAAYARLGKDIEKYEKIGDTPSKELAAYRSELSQQKRNIASVQNVLLHALASAGGILTRVTSHFNRKQQR